MVVDEFWNGVKVVLLCQVVQALRRGADVIMFAASCRFPVGRGARLKSSRSRQQIFIHTAGCRVCMSGCYLLSYRKAAWTERCAPKNRSGGRFVRVLHK